MGHKRSYIDYFQNRDRIKNRPPDQNGLPPPSPMGSDSPSTADSIPGKTRVLFDSTIYLPQTVTGVVINTFLVGRIFCLKISVRIFFYLGAVSRNLFA